MVKTYGLTHMAIGVRDPARAYAFYRAVLGMEAVYTESDFIQAQTPGTRDVLVFERAPARAGRKGGIAHFGFRLTRRKTSRTLCRPWSPPEDAYSVTASSARVSLICSARTPTATKWRSGTSCRRRSIRNHGLSEIGHGPGVPTRLSPFEDENVSSRHSFHTTWPLRTTSVNSALSCSTISGRP